MSAEDSIPDTGLEGFAQRVARNWTGLDSDPELLELAVDAFQDAPEFRRKERFQQALKRLTISRIHDGSPYRPTQADMARLVDRKPPQLSHYLGGEAKNFPQKYQVALADKMCVPATWLHEGQVGPDGRDAPAWLQPAISQCLRIVRHLARVHIAHFITDWACVPEVIQYRPASILIDGLPDPDRDLTRLPSMQSNVPYWFQHTWAGAVDKTLTKDAFAPIYQLLQGTGKTLGEIFTKQRSTVTQAWHELQPVIAELLTRKDAPILGRLKDKVPGLQHEEAMNKFVASWLSSSPGQPPSPGSVHG